MKQFLRDITVHHMVLIVLAFISVLIISLSALSSTASTARVRSWMKAG